jgi:hypothetical protein
MPGGGTTPTELQQAGMGMGAVLLCCVFAVCGAVVFVVRKLLLL